MKSGSYGDKGILKTWKITKVPEELLKFLENTSGYKHHKLRPVNIRSDDLSVTYS